MLELREEGGRGELKPLISSRACTWNWPTMNIFIVYPKFNNINILAYYQSYTWIFEAYK